MRDATQSTFLLAGLVDGSIKCWQLGAAGTPPQPKPLLQGHKGQINGFTISGNCFYAASADGIVSAWQFRQDTATFEAIGHVEAHPGGVATIAKFTESAAVSSTPGVAPAGADRIVTGPAQPAQDAFIKLWDIGAIGAGAQCLVPLKCVGGAHRGAAGVGWAAGL